MKADCVKIIFSYSADLPYNTIQSHSCLYSRPEKKLGLLFISISEMAHLWLEQADPVYIVSHSCDFILSLTKVYLPPKITNF